MEERNDHHSPRDSQTGPPDRYLVVDNHDRSQAYRRPLWRHRVRDVLLRRHRGDADSRPAHEAGAESDLSRNIQSAIHDARHDDDLPWRNAAVGGLLQLRRSAADRRSRRRVPQAKRVQLLDVPRRGADPQTELVHALRSQRGLVRILAAHGYNVQSGPRHRRLDPVASGAWHSVAGGVL